MYVWLGIAALCVALLAGGCTKPTYEQNLAKNMINDAKSVAANKPNAAGTLSNAEKLMAEGDALQKKYQYDKAKQKYDQAYGEAKKAYEAGVAKDCINPKLNCVADAKQPPKEGKSYNVVKGDCLWKISGKNEIYNDPFQWPLIYDANKDQIDKKAKDSHLPKMRVDGYAHWIFPGQAFSIPSASMDQIKDARKRAGAPAPYTPPGSK